MHSELSLVGPRIRLRPLQADDAQALVHAAADGKPWNLNTTVVPRPNTIDDYIGTALRGPEAGTVMPFVTEVKPAARSSARRVSGIQ